MYRMTPINVYRVIAVKKSGEFRRPVPGVVDDSWCDEFTKDLPPCPRDPITRGSDDGTSDDGTLLYHNVNFHTLHSDSINA